MLIVHSGANGRGWFVTSVRRFRIGHGTVVVTSTLALVLGIFRPDTHLVVAPPRRISLVEAA